VVYSIKDLIHGAFDNPNIAAKARENMIFPFWNFIVGPKIACHTNPYRLEDGILKVMVSSSSWAQQLSFMKEQILRGYLEMTGEELVKDIRFQIGKKIPDSGKKDKVEQLTLDFNKFKYPDEFQLGRIQLPVETLFLIDEQVKFIKDEQLRTQMKSVMEKDFKIKIWKEMKGWKLCPLCNVFMEPGQKICMICNLDDNKPKKKSRGRKKQGGKM
jgi:predicted nucleic acid-binding Zn ribbon protein